MKGACNVFTQGSLDFRSRSVSNADLRFEEMFDIPEFALRPGAEDKLGVLDADVSPRHLLARLD
jgi:hypothetical protein